MSWLTQAELRRNTPQARQLAAQLLRGAERDKGHGLVWNLFSSDPGARRDFLYREVETGRFIIVSQREPRAEPAIWTVHTRPYAPRIIAGERYGFSLCANPTVAVSRPGRARSHRADVLMHAKRDGKDQIEAAQSWLLAREKQLGVSFDRSAPNDEGLGGVQIGQVEPLKLSRPGAAKRAHLTAVDYRGVLTVTAPERLLCALIDGIGRGKAFGLGLMLLHRLDK